MLNHYLCDSEKGCPAMINHKNSYRDLKVGSMCRSTLKIVQFLILFFWGTALHAAETAGLRGLQTGPIGEGVAFVDLGPADLEFLMRFVSTNGSESYGEEDRSISGQTNHLALASGFAVNDDLDFIVQISRSQTEFSGESISDTIGTATLSKDRTEISAGPSLWFGNLLLGAHASMRSYGKEKIRVGETSTTIDAAILPRLKLFSGLRSGSVTTMARILLYNDIRTRSTTYSPESGFVKKKVKKRDAAETSLDGRLQINPQFAFAASLAFIGAEQASEDKSAQDYFKYSFGGIHTASEWLTLTGGIHYTQPYFKNASDASIFSENLGGLRIDFGFNYTLRDYIGVFDIGYTIPELATYTDEQGGDIETERAEWDLLVGLILKR